MILSKTIILDVDGTLLFWRDAFIDWLRRFDLIDEDDSHSYFFKEFIRVPGDPEYRSKNDQFANALSEIFNQTYLLSKLPPMGGAIPAIRKLSEAGCILKVVSSYTTQYEAMKSREYNLKTLFGNVFQEIVSLPLYASKNNYLSKQDRDSYFIEDSLSHLKDAEALGFDPNNLFLIPANYNADAHAEYVNEKKYVEHSGFIRRMNWDQITKEILGE